MDTLKRKSMAELKKMTRAEVAEYQQVEAQVGIELMREWHAKYIKDGHSVPDPAKKPARLQGRKKKTTS